MNITDDKIKFIENKLDTLKIRSDLPRQQLEELTDYETKSAHITKIKLMSQGLEQKLIDTRRENNYRK